MFNFKKNYKYWQFWVRLILTMPFAVFISLGVLSENILYGFCEKLPEIPRNKEKL